MLSYRNWLIVTVFTLLGVSIGLSFRAEAVRTATRTVLKHHAVQCNKAVQTIAVMAYLKGKEDGCITH